MAFDHDFFQTQLAPLVGEWMSHRNLTALETVVTMTLVDGRQLALTGIRVAPTWIVALTEDDEMWLLPFERIANVEARRRPGPPGERTIGFRVGESIAANG